MFMSFGHSPGEGELGFMKSYVTHSTCGTNYASVRYPASI